MFRNNFCEQDSKIWVVLIGMLVAFVVALIVLTAIQGCASVPISEVLPSTPARVLTKFIFTPDLFFTLTIVGIMAGVFAFLNGQRIGIPLIIACFTGLMMKLAVVRFGFWIGLFGAVGSLATLIYTIVVKDNALKDIISGVQLYREATMEHDGLDNKLELFQSGPTKKLVKKIKEKL